MKIQTGSDCSAVDREQLVPPVVRRRRRVLIGNWQAALQAVTIFVSVISLTLSSIVFMVLLYTPASSPLGQAREMADMREVVDMQRRMIERLQREDNYQDAKQKALQSALAAAGLLTDEVRARLEGIERALMAKEQEDVPEDIAELVSIGAQQESSSLIGRPDGHELGRQDLIGRPDGHERGRQDLIGRPDGHEKGREDLIGRPDADEIGRHDLIGRHDGHERNFEDLLGRPDGHERSFPSEESYEDITA